MILSYAGYIEVVPHLTDCTLYSEDNQITLLVNGELRVRSFVRMFSGCTALRKVLPEKVAKTIWHTIIDHKRRLLSFYASIFCVSFNRGTQ